MLARHSLVRKRASWSCVTTAAGGKKNGRFFAAAVKELSWCAPSDSPTRRQRKNTIPAVNQEESEKLLPTHRPIERFGIVGAMSKNRVIGINGKLPWSSLPEDRKLFKRLTSGKILIVGRHTFCEEADRSHVSHASHCIVVSTTMTEDDANIGTLQKATSRNDALRIRVVPSLAKALDLARELLSNETADDKGPSPSIECWVGGGERLFEEALMHPSAQTLSLTVVDTEIALEGLDDVTTVARFPPKYRWDFKFKQVSADERTDGPVNFTHYVYERIQGK